MNPADLTVKNYSQQAVTAGTDTGVFQRIVRVSYDVYCENQRVAHHEQDYPPAAADTQTINNDLNTYLRELRNRLQNANIAKG